MPFNQKTGGAAIVAAADIQVGKPYSELGPPGSDDDGHYWQVGEPAPTAFDCSGLTRYATLFVGCPIVPGDAESQWEQSLGGRVPDNEPLLPGDICAFWGAENVPGYAGHTGIVKSYDTTSGTGMLVNAYDTDFGVCYTPFTRFQPNNENNGLGWIGAYRPANSLPPAPKPPAPPAAPNPSKKPPNAAQLKQTNLVLLKNVAQAERAQKNGWALWYWAVDGHFHAQINGKPTGTPLYANANWQKSHSVESITP
jgi:hypothetical protein